VTFTREDICPECGHAFDRTQLEQWYTPYQPSALGPLWPGSRVSVATASLFMPGRVGRFLPPRPNQARINEAAAVSRLIALILFVILLIGGFASLQSGTTVVIVLVLGPIAAWSLSDLCESTIALLAARLVEPVGVQAHNRRLFWRCLCRCFSTHLAVHMSLLCCSAIAIVLLAENSAAFRASPVSVLGLLMAPTLISMSWWWLCLGRAIWVRGIPSTGRTILILLIPIIGGAYMVLFTILSGIGGAVR
jgi:hypothetical protein